MKKTKREKISRMNEKSEITTWNNNIVILTRVGFLKYKHTCM
jgi:hypothetical protein